MQHDPLPGSSRRAEGAHREGSYGTAGHGCYSFRCLDDFQPELAVLDILLPDGSGLDLCQALRGHDPDVAVAAEALAATDALLVQITAMTAGRPKRTRLLAATRGIHEAHRSLLAEDPDALVAPFLMSGGTDAKHFRKLGMRSYGFTPLRLPADLDFTALFHGVDERVPVDALEFGARVFDRFLDEV